MKQFFRKHKELFTHVIAFFIALAILGFCVLGSYAFSVPASAADTYLDSYSTYMQNVYDGHGASSTGTDFGTWFDAVTSTISYCLEHPLPTGGKYNTSQLSMWGGYYYKDSNLPENKRFCSSTVFGSYQASDGWDIATSNDFNIKVQSVLEQGASASFSGAISQYGVVTFGCSVGGNPALVYFDTYSNSGNLFNTDHVETTASNWAYSMVKYGSSIPVISSGSSLSNYMGYSKPYQNPVINNIAGNNASTVSYLASHQFKDIPDLADVEFTDAFDFYFDYFAPYIEVNYPDYVIYLFDPDDYIDPTENTDTTECTECGGCNCTHNITVNVEPTINVYVENDFPSEWQEDYTFSTDPVETLMEPTMPTDENGVPETLPPFEIDSGLQDGLHFWGELWTSLVFAADYLPVIIILLLLSIVEWVLWKVGR